MYGVSMEDKNKLKNNLRQYVCCEYGRQKEVEK